MSMSYAEFLKYTLQRGPTWKGGVSFQKWFRASMLWRRSAIAAWMLNSSAFAVNLTHTAAPTRAATGTTATFTRATTKTWTNNDGYQVTGVAGEIGFVGARRVRNLVNTTSEDFSNAAWVKIVSTVTSGFSDPDGGTNAFRLQSTGVGGYIEQSITTTKLPIANAAIMSWYIKSNTGAAQTVKFARFAAAELKTVTTSWQRLEHFTASAGGSNFYIQDNGGNNLDVLIYKCQIEDVTGQSVQTASEYVSVGAVQRNYVFYSNNPVYWSVVSNVTVTPNQLANPVNGALNAWKVAATTAGATNLNTTLGITALATKATASFYAHKGSGATDANKFALYNNTTASILSLVSIDYDTGILTTLSGAAGTSSDAGNGWWRISLSATSGISVGNQLLVYACFTGNAETAGEYAYLYGTQGEFESAATSYQDVGGSYIYHGSMVDGVKCFDTDRSGNPISTSGSYPIVGYVPWEARTNLALQSQTFGTTWLVANASVSADAATAPDGTTTADKITPSAINTTHAVYQTFVKAASALQYTFSVWAKPAGYDFLSVGAFDSAANGVYAIYNVLTGVVATSATGLGVAFTTLSASVLSSENGLYRLSLTFTTNTDTALRIFAEPQDSARGAAASTTWLPNGTSGCYLWGAQLELGSFAGPYIPTTTVAVARNADVLSYTGADVANIKALAATFRREVGVSSVGALVSLNDNTADNYNNIALADATTMSISGVASGAAQWAIGGAYTPAAFAKVSNSVATNDIKADLNGTALTPDTSATTPVVTRLDVGHFEGAYQLNGHVGNIYGWTSNKSQSELGAIDR